MDQSRLGRAYVYLLGFYLGDGVISKSGHRGVWRLRIYQDARYPDLIGQFAEAIRHVRGSTVNSAPKVVFLPKAGCIEIGNSWKHWPCVVPQHGPGEKHLRRIVLEMWQEKLVAAFPDALLRGLIQSDGCRVINRVKKRRYAYPRYFFTSHSDDIRALFVSACEMVGVECRPNNRWNISVARRASVAILDSFIGPKS